MTDRARALGLHSSLTGMSSSRGEITDYHVRFARDRRPGVSWQNLARMLGVNAVDLERVVRVGLNRPSLVALPPQPSAPPMADPRLTSLGYRLLRAIADSAAVDPRVLAGRWGLSVQVVQTASSLLVKRGWVERSIGKAGRLVATKVGLDALVRIERAPVRPAGTPRMDRKTRSDAALLLLAEGLDTIGEIRERMNVAHTTVGELLRCLEHDGLVRGGVTKGRKYAWAMTSAGERRVEELRAEGQSDG